MQLTEFKADVQRHFDERAHRYDEDTQTYDTEDFANFKTILPYMVSQLRGSILDVATGSGIILKMLLDTGQDGYGMDLSPGLLAVATRERHIPAERLFCGDAERLTFADNQFSAACIFRSLHHIERPDLVVAEMARCAERDIFIYESAGTWRRQAKRLLQKVGLYQPMYRLLRGKQDTGYRPASETEGPVKVFYVEDAIPPLRAAGARVVAIQKFPTAWLIHARKQGAKHPRD